MKKLFYLMSVLAVVLLASCSKQKQSANLVPDDAFAVFRFDLVQASDKMGLSDGESSLKKKIKDELKDMGLNRELRQKMEQIIDDPTSSGIDLTEPMFLYVAGDVERKPDAALVGTLASASDLAELLNAVAEESGMDKVDQRDGVNVFGDREFCIIFDDGWFYMGTSKDADETIKALKERLEGKGTLAENKAFLTMAEKKGIAQMLIMGKGISEMRDFREVAKAMPDGLDIADMAWLQDLAVEKGETTLTAECVAMSNEWQEYIDATDKAMNAIDKSQTKYISDQGFSAFANIDNEAITRWLEKAAKASGARGEDLSAIKKLCKAIDGTAAFDFYGISTDGPQFTAYVGTKDNTLLNMFTQMGVDADELEETGNNQYRMPVFYEYNWDDDDYSRVPTKWGALGFKNGQSYFSMDEDNVFNTPDKKYPTGDIKGKGVYMRFNFNFLNGVADELWGTGSDIAEEVANVFDYAESYCDEGGKAVLRLVNKNKRKTLFDIISDEVKKYGEMF